MTPRLNAIASYVEGIRAVELQPVPFDEFVK
jgi:hypothetical protein